MSDVSIEPRPTDDVTLPPADRCAWSGGVCQRTRAEHDIAWVDGGPTHEFVPPEGLPRPEHTTSCHIQTDWTCTHCGAENDVWGTAAVEWMECARCGGQSFLVPFLTVSEPVDSGSMSVADDRVTP